MKKIILMALLSVMLAVTVNAQQGIRHMGGLHKMGHLSKKQRHKVIKDLHLTKDQKALWKSSKSDFKARQKAIKSNSTLTPDQKKTQLQELKRERMEKMRTILTPEQLKTFQTEMKQIH